MTVTEIPTAADEEVPKPQLAAALAAFQAEIPRIAKESKATITAKEGKQGYDYDYADLGTVVVAAMPLLGKHGLAFLAKPTWVLLGSQPTFCLVYKLMHESGEQEVGIWPLPPPDRAGPQQLGGAITYARRYAFQAVTGVAPEKGSDDDGVAAEQGPRPEPAPNVPQRIEPGQKRRINNRFTEMGIADDEEVRMAWVTGMRGEYTESLDALSRYHAAALLDQLKPAGRQARGDVIATLGTIGVSDKDEVLAKLTEWTGRPISGTDALTVYEVGLAMREAGRVRHEQEEAAKAGENSQEVPPGDSTDG